MSRNHDKTVGESPKVLDSAPSSMPVGRNSSSHKTYTGIPAPRTSTKLATHATASTSKPPNVDLFGGMLQPFGAGAPVVQMLAKSPTCLPPSKSPLPKHVELHIIKLLTKPKAADIYAYLHTLAMPYRATLLTRINDPKDAIAKKLSAVGSPENIQLVKKLLRQTSVDVPDYGQPTALEPFAQGLTEDSIEVEPKLPILGAAAAIVLKTHVMGAKPPKDLKVHSQLVSPDGIIVTHGDAGWKLISDRSESFAAVVMSPGRWSVVVEIADGPKALRRIRKEINVHQDVMSMAADAVKSVATASASGASGAAGAAGAKAAPMAKLGGYDWYVDPKETLWTISEMVYGHGRYWRRIRNVNRGKIKKGGHLIFVGTTLKLPELQLPVGEAAKGLQKHNNVALRRMTSSLPPATYDAFLAGLNEEQRQDYGETIQLVELMRATGKTIDGLSDDQQKFLEDQAKRKGVTVGEFVHSKINKYGYGGNKVDWWPNLKKPDKKAWRKRFKAAEAKVRATAPPKVKKAIATADKRGGGFVWEPNGNQESGAFAYSRRDYKLYCGQRWVEAAESNIAKVYANALHELVGHANYGNTLGDDITGGAVNNFDPAEKTKALAGKKRLSSTYGYPETEIWAELRELSADDEHNATDHPTGDVTAKLQQIKTLFAPNIAVGLVKSLWRRMMLDSRITMSARKMYRENVRLVFGLDLRS